MTQETVPVREVCEVCDEPKADKLPERCGKCGLLACTEHFQNHWCVRVAEDRRCPASL